MQDPTDYTRPAVPSPQEWESYCESVRAAEPRARRLADLGVPPAAEWFASQVSFHRHLSRAKNDYHDLISTALRDAELVLREAGVRTAADLVGRKGTRYHGVVLRAVELPREARTTQLANMLDEDAGYYLDLETDSGRLAAYELLRTAEIVERMGSQTVEAYYDDEAAYIAALESVALEAGYPGVMW